MTNHKLDWWGWIILFLAIVVIVSTLFAKAKINEIEDRLDIITFMYTNQLLLQEEVGPGEAVVCVPVGDSFEEGVRCMTFSTSPDTKPRVWVCKPPTSGRLYGNCVERSKDET